MPRKISKLAATQTPQPSANQPRTAAHDAYSVPELRARIYSFLSKHDLTRCMRVEKAGMAAVAEQLYHTMPFHRVKNNMTLSTPRQRTYCAAVHTVDARKLSLTPTMMKGIDTGIVSRGVYWTHAIERYLRSYHVEVMELLLPILRKKCVNLRTIIFGAERTSAYDDAWIVHLSPDDPHSGHVTLLRCLDGPADEAPSDTLPATPPAPAGFTISRRWDLRLLPHYMGEPATSPAHELWLQALREKPYFAELGSVLKFDTLPIGMGDLAHLLSRQSEAHPAQQPREIVATHILPCSSADFVTFASSAPRSLRTLHLVDKRNLRGTETLQSMSFADLPEVVSLIRGSLPNLAELILTLRGVETAEADCSAALSIACLESGGSVTNLRIITEQHRTPLFNTLRCLYPMCNAGVKPFNIHVGPVTSKPEHAGSTLGRAGIFRFRTRNKELDQEVEQLAFLEYLQRQSGTRRVHLATTDFTLLGLTQLSEVKDLTYHDDGHPRSKAESSVSRWVRDAQSSACDIPELYIPRLETGLGEYASAAKGLEQALGAGDEDPAQILEKAEKLQSALRGVKSMSRAIQGSVSGGAGIDEYVELLRRQVGDTGTSSVPLGRPRSMSGSVTSDG